MVSHDTVTLASPGGTGRAYGRRASDFFGVCSASGDTWPIKPRRPRGWNGRRSAYVFVRSGGVWIQQPGLALTRGGRQFGRSVPATAVIAPGDFNLTQAQPRVCPLRWRLTQGQAHSLRRGDGDYFGYSALFRRYRNRGGRTTTRAEPVPAGEVFVKPGASDGTGC
jgi:hypothetical protein